MWSFFYNCTVRNGRYLSISIYVKQRLNLCIRSKLSYQGKNCGITHVECSQQPSHSDFLLEHFSGALLLESAFNTDFPSMIRLNNIIEVTKSAVCDSYGECLICITLLLALAGRNDVPLDWLRSQFSPRLPNPNW